MKVAIYTRKSKITDRGESIGNQIAMCENYAKMNFGVSEKEIVVYTDEGFSGGTTDRPKFKRLMQDIEKKCYDVLICYRLDRISRNVLDFSNILDTLNKVDASFVSITEHFDTTTPMGRAMVNIAAVFAQLERETIAERIKDNMRRLARTGRYLGSTPPYGFRSEKVEYIDPQGNKKKMHKLTAVNEEMGYVRLVYGKYAELRGLAKVETWLMQNKRMNKNGNYSGVSELRRMLTNPVYVRADDAVWDYYTKLGADVVNDKEEFNGKNGMLIYGRHDRSKGSHDPKCWTVVLAKHDGIIDSEQWIFIQNLLERNKAKAPRAGSSRNALLTSKIKCANCGGTMVVTYGISQERHYYKCRNKIKSRKTLCDIKNINGRSADKVIYDYLKSLSDDRNRITETLRKQSNRQYGVEHKSVREQGAFVRKAIKEKMAEIKNITIQLRKNEASIAARYIIAEIEQLSGELDKLQQDLAVLEDQENKMKESKMEEEIVTNAIIDFGKASHGASLEEQRGFIDQIVDKIIWDGSNLTVYFK